MADQHRIVLESSDPITELSTKLETYSFQDGLNYFVDYLRDHNRIESEGDNEDEYYKA